MGPSEYPDMARDVHSMPTRTMEPFAAPPAMAAGRDQASYSYPPQAQAFSYPGTTNPNIDAELKLQQMRLEHMRLDDARREREDRKEREAYERQRDAAHQRAFEMNAQSQALQASLNAQINTTAIVGRADGGYGYGYENYCGPVSWIIGLFLFPCICFCPVDTRMVAPRAVPVVAAPSPLYGPVAGVPIYNAPAHVAAK